METYEFDHTMFNRQGAGDETLFVQFRMDFLPDEPESAKEGRPMFKDVEFIRIIVPGDRNNMVDRPASREDKARFPKQYTFFKEGKEQHGGGTPIAEWPLVSRAMAENLKYLGFHTVEQLAEANDSVMGSHIGVLGLSQLKQRAQMYIMAAKDSTAPIEHLTAENAKKDTEIRMLKDALEELKKEVKSLNKNAA